MKKIVLIILVTLLIIPIVLLASNFSMGRGVRVKRVSALPATGYPEGSVIYDNTTHKSYISTTTVNDVKDWVELTN